MTLCGNSINEVGPFQQTLFLGCSIVDFNCNLGWGADSSSMTVTLVEDTSAHFKAAKYQQTFIQTLKSIAAQQNTKAAQPSDQRLPSKLLSAQPYNGFADTDKNAFITEMLDIEEKNNSLIKAGGTDQNGDGILPQEPEMGKNCNNPDGTRGLWLDVDPGFLGATGTGNPVGKAYPSGFDIIGAPVCFKYSTGNFAFCGLVSSWKKNIANDGIKYTVELKNFSSLLSNTQLIIGHYGGSIFYPANNTNAGGNPLKQRVGIPGPTGATPLNPFSYGSSQIKHGNMPNVINIYGYLTKWTGYGGVKENEQGIPASMIYDAIKNNLCATGVVAVHSNEYSPYGGIVTKSVGYVPKGRAGNDYQIPNASSIRFASNVGGGQISLCDLGVMPTVTCKDTSFKSVFALDISEIPKPPSWLRIKGPVITVMDFISQICDGSGHDFFIDTLPLKKGSSLSSKFSGIIKVRTISRKIQPEKNKILNYINRLQNQGVRIQSHSYGQEHNDASPVRTMYIGGKQQRLLQYKNLRFTWNQHTLVYDAHAGRGAGSFVLVPRGATYNFFRQPAPTSYRSKDILQGSHLSVIDHGLNFLPTATTNFAAQQFSEGGFGNVQLDPDHTNIRPGNYLRPKNFPDTFSSNVEHAIPLFYDVICPFYGKHFDGSTRRVFYDQSMGQVQVLFKIQDLFVAGNTLPYAGELDFNLKYFLVLENEIRAAGAGFEQWLSYCFDNGFYTDIERLTYRALFRKYGAAAKNDISSIHKGLIHSLVNGNVKMQTRGGFGVDNFVPYQAEVYSTLRSIHQIFKNIADEHYGKSYMVSMPQLNSYRDFTKTNIVVGYGLNAQGTEDRNSPIYATEGTNKLYTDISVASNGAWEEPGNIIDNAIAVGSQASHTFYSDENLIQPILGFNTTASLDSKFQSYWDKVFNGTMPWGNPLASPALNFFIGGYNIMKAVRYPLTTEIDPSEYVHITRNVAANDAHGNQGYWPEKTYFKCSANPELEYIEDIELNTTYIKAIINLSSPVNLNTRNANAYQLKSVMLQDTYIRLSAAFGRFAAQVPYMVKGTPLAGLLANISDFQDTVARNYYRTETILGGLLPKLYLLRNFGSVIAGEQPKLQRMFIAAHIAYLRSLGEDGLNGIFPYQSNDIGDSYDNAAILPKAAIPTFAALPVTYNNYVYGPWIDYPSFIGTTIFPEYKDITDAAKKIENLIGGVKVEVDPELTPWNFGSMSVLDKNIAARINDDVTYQQEIENGTIVVPILPDINLGDILDNNGPVLNNINVQIGREGATTSLVYRTYTRKLGLFNKENAERIKRLTLETLKRNKEINSAYQDLRKRIQTGNVGSSNTLNSTTYDVPKMFRWSPMEILVGTSSICQPLTSTLNNYAEIGYSPSWHIKPIPSASKGAYEGKSVKQSSKVNLQDYREAPRELTNNYATKAIMSMDGLLSPVSLFPTPHGGTYHMSKYETVQCPICLGKKTYNYSQATNIQGYQGSNSANDSKTTTTITCDFCETKNLALEKSKTAFGSEPEPPYILAADSDITVIRNIVRQNLSVPRSIINYTSLNPLVLPSGEFSNINKQADDNSAFVIDSVAYGVVPPYLKREGLNSLGSDSVGAIYSDKDIAYSNYLQSTNQLEANSQVSNNHRFLGLRGPLVMHGWGYDTDGYPVPNAADEPLLDGNGRLRRDANGEIIKKGDKLVNNQIVPQEFSRSGTFYAGWSQLQGSWPVGPVDLRWDRNAKVWTIGSNNYRPVFVVLEEDLTDQQPVRATLLNNNPSNAPTANNLRKLVFVKDNKGITAPRGAKVYCRYSNQNGFYEPLYSSPLSTTGIIQSSSSATIYKAYSIPPGISTSDQKNTDSYSTTYQNPLKFNVVANSPALFIYINGSWVLQAINSSC